MAATRGVKSRNGGQWTEARFDSFVRGALRSASRRWPPKYETLKAAFVGVKLNTKSKRQAKHYTCAICQGEFPSTQIQVDHIVPIGFDVTWDEFVNGLFCESDNLQAVCLVCHKAKTKKERESNGS